MWRKMEKIRERCFCCFLDGKPCTVVAENTAFVSSRLVDTALVDQIKLIDE
jgi:hypothetical protein